MGMNFFVPSYQRGYRWEIQQVKDLLEDIKDFTNKPKRSEYEFYCLQPLVVRQMSAKELERVSLPTDETWYEVIDGQQRLTTIYLILYSFISTLELMGLPTNIFNIKYEREMNNKGGSFFEEIERIEKPDDSSIDRLHLSNNLLYIQEWKQRKRVNWGHFCNALLDEKIQDIEGRPKDSAHNIRFIWYETVDENPINVFTRLNIGKISLTNSELVKALLLNIGNFKETDKKTAELRKKEIASEWDSIERTLHDESFWYFLNNEECAGPTRIDFIFDIIKNQNALTLSDEERKDAGSDEYATFRYFYAYFAKNSDKVAECWKRIKSYFQTFMEWYNDIELYHYIGFLIKSTDHTTQSLIEKWKEKTDKNAFRNYVLQEIGKKINTAPVLDFQYDTEGSNKGRARPILLFHNIQTAIDQNKKTRKDITTTIYRFPFDLYQKEKWDVEHINSNTTNPEDDVDTQKEWMVNAYLSVPEEIQQEIRKFFDLADCDTERANAIFEEVRKIVPDQENWSQEEKNRIWNFTLLDRHTNRSYGNALFSGKRRIIIGKERGETLQIPYIKDGKIEFTKKGSETKSCFVPPVTRQIFMKYYSPVIGNSNYWTFNDAKAYSEDLKRCIGNLKDKIGKLKNKADGE